MYLCDLELKGRFDAVKLSLYSVNHFFMVCCMRFALWYFYSMELLNGNVVIFASSNYLDYNNNILIFGTPPAQGGGQPVSQDHRLRPGQGHRRGQGRSYQYLWHAGVYVARGGGNIFSELGNIFFQGMIW